ncbi:MAG: hypothetical protein LBF41_03260, partial [Deltaproteobacteria bacterium]|nr:hypothetical protein [Deltaproteobacteria bacterium]
MRYTKHADTRLGPGRGISPGWAIIVSAMLVFVLYPSSLKAQITTRTSEILAAAGNLYTASDFYVTPAPYADGILIVRNSSDVMQAASSTLIVDSAVTQALLSISVAAGANLTSGNSTQVIGNIVDIRANVSGSAYGGMSWTGNANAVTSGNEVTVETNVTMANDVMGAMANAGEVRLNKVSVHSGASVGNAFGGAVEAATQLKAAAYENEVTVTGGKVTVMVVGGAVAGGSSNVLENNTATLTSGADGSANVKGVFGAHLSGGSTGAALRENKVTITQGATVGTTGVFGAYGMDIANATLTNNSVTINGDPTKVLINGGVYGAATR